MTLTAVPGITVGHAQVPGDGSGCTVIIGPFRGAVEVRGMATGSRELDVLSPSHLVGEVHALLLTGGSAFGLAAAEGVMESLAERGVGFVTGVAPVPVVPGAVIFDLALGRERPGPEEGRRAVEEASDAPVLQGRVGAGAGATVGKILGPEAASPGGLGSASGTWRSWAVGALAVVNALGDVVGSTGEILAGPRGPEGAVLSTDHLLREEGEGLPSPLPGTNTTLAVVATNAPLSRTDLGRVGRVAAGAFPRAIAPVNTPFDGDLLFSLSTGALASELARTEEKAGFVRDPRPFSPSDLLSLGVVARRHLEEAIRNAVRQPG